MVQAAQFEGAKSGTLRKLAVLTGAGMLALALATPAHADDQAPPPPLMLGKTAMIAPDEPDATPVPVDAGATETVSAPAPPPDPVPPRTVAPTGWKLAAKPRVMHRAAPVRIHVRVQYAPPAPVISPRARQVHVTPPHRTVKRVDPRPSRARPRWYQVRPAQYRNARADSGGGRPKPVSVTMQKPIVGSVASGAAQPQRTRTICELRLRKCLQLCSWNASDNGPQNGRWIGVCISSPDLVSRLDRVHELLLQRLWSIALDVRRAVSGRQYQCFATQYQSGTCVAEGTPPATATFGWVAVGAQTKPAVPVASGTAPAVASSVARVTSHRRGRVLAAVAAHRTPAVRTVVHSSPARRPREVAPATATRTESRASSDWLLRTLFVLIGLAMLALLLAAGSELPGAGAALTGLRTRLASKGLSSGRIELGRERPAAPPRGRGISYRD